jgi:signal transduction histidine kinase
MYFSKKPNPKPEPVSINEAVEDAIGLTHSLIKYSKIIIEKKLDPVNPLVMGEKGRLQEVFVALILNAFEAMAGKGTLKILTVPVHELGVVEITVSDNGIGIQPQDMRRIKSGELFFATGEADRRLGLGLVTTREIVAKHGGTINIESTLGKGTTFIIQFPSMRTEGESACNTDKAIL